LEEVGEWLYYLQFSLYWVLLWNFTKIIERIWKNEYKRVWRFSHDETNKTRL
jgi:hypothetical protein